MPSKTVTVGSSVGLHARPADIISKAASQLEADVTIGKPDGNQVDAGSALFIMTVGAACGDEVVVTSDDEAAMERIASLVEQDLDDEDWVDEEGEIDPDD
jgi:phosphocarrier protein HPr